MRKFIYILIVAVTILIAQNVYEAVGNIHDEESEQPDALTVVSQVFRQKQIESLDCDISAFYFYGVCYLNEEEKAMILEKVASELGIDSTFAYSEQRTEQGAEAVLTKEGANSVVCLKLITYEIPEGENVVSLRQYISVDMTIQNSITSGLFYKQKLEKILKDLTTVETDGEVYENDNLISISIKGNMAGKLDIDSQEKIAGEILDGLDAKTVFQYKPAEEDTESSYSIYGYTKDMDEHLVIGNNKINVNVVYSYDEAENITTLHVASPIANYDY